MSPLNVRLYGGRQLGFCCVFLRFVMLDWFLAFDQFLYYAFNHGWANPVFDMLMPVVTNVKMWMPVYVVGLALLVWRGGRRGRVCTCVLLSCILISDATNSRLLKEQVQRVRPSVALSDARVLVPAGGSSFPSTHATNNFAAAVVLSFFYRRLRVLWFAIAVVIAFSRVYVGVHYPLDVFAGAIEGLLLASLLLHVYTALAKRYAPLRLNDTVPE